MALGSLFILYIVLGITALVIQILLYAIRSDSNYVNLIFIVNTLFALILSGLAYTALPSNYVGSKSVGIIWGVIAIVAMVLKLTNKRFTMISKVMLTLAITGALVQLFL